MPFGPDLRTVPRASWRDEVLERARRLGAEESSNAATGQGPKLKIRRRRTSCKQKRAHILNENVVNAALSGEHLAEDGERTVHPKKCHAMLQNGSACYTGLWSSKDAYIHHITEFTRYAQEVRSEIIFQMLKDCYYADHDAAGQPKGGKYWHYYVNADQCGIRSVCRHVFLLNYPISNQTLKRLKRRILEGCTMAHAKKEEGGGGLTPLAEVLRGLATP